MPPPLRRLPSADRSIIEQSKLTEYLLNGSHPDNGGKARFFESMGFSASQPKQLADALRQQSAIGAVVQEVVSVHGTKYVVDGRVASPNGAQRSVRTVWIVDNGQDVPRLVTAYPREE